MTHKAAGGISSRNVTNKPVKTGVGARAVNKNWPATVGLSRGNKVMHQSEPLRGVRADPYKGPSFNPAPLGNAVAASTQCGVGGSRTIHARGAQGQHGNAVPGVSRPSTKGQWPD